MISILIPAYNEEATIGKLVDGLEHALAAEKRKYEIIVLDDCSSDGTLRLLQEKKQELKRKQEELERKWCNNLRIIHKKNRTFGDLTPAVRIAKGNILARMDADLEHDPADLPKLIRFLEKRNLDLAIGRRSEFSRMAETLLRRMGSYPIRDIFSGYIVFSRALVPLIHACRMKQLYYELPLCAIAAKCRIGEVPVSFHRRDGAPRIGGELLGGLRSMRCFLDAKRKARIVKANNLRVAEGL